MDRVEHAVDHAGHGLAVAVGKERSDLALVHPRDRVDVQAGLALAGVAVVPGAELAAAAVVPGAEDEDVALLEAHALGALGLFELRAPDGLARLEVGNAAQARDVEQHAAADDAVGGVGHRHGRGTAARDRRGGTAVVHLTAVGDVAERVDVGVAVAVEVHAEEVQREGQLARADVEVVHLHHVVDRRVRVVRSGLRVDRDRHRDRAARAHERGRAAHVLGRDVVEGAEHVVGPPAPPVLDRLEDRLELLERDVRASALAWSSCCSLDQVRRLLADHDRRGVGVAARDRRHDGGIGDAQALEAVDAQLGVDDRSDRAGRGRVVDGVRRAPDEVHDLVVRVAGRRGVRLAHDLPERLLLGDLERLAHAREHALAILLGGQEVAQHDRLGVRHRRAQLHEATARRLDHDRAEAVAVVVGSGQPLVVEHRARVVELHVGRVQPRARAEEGGGLGIAGRERPAALLRAARSSPA